MSHARPSTLEEACAWLSGRQATIAAGCTDLFAATERKRLAGPVLDITAIDSLRTISRDRDGWRIGAAVTWSEVVGAELPPAFDALKQAAREVGGIQIQNSGTVGGNLCNASPAADGVPPLLCLDAEVELASASGARRLPLGDFLTGPRETALRRGEILAAILVPGSSAHGRSAFFKLGARRHLVISIVMAAARVEITDGAISDAAIAIGACGPVAQRLPALEAALIDRPATALSARDIDPALVAGVLSPIDDIRADAAYRVRAAVTAVQRLLAGLGAETAP